MELLRSNHRSILHALLVDGCIDAVQSFYFPKWLLQIFYQSPRSATFLDLMIQFSACNEAQYSLYTWLDPPAERLNKFQLWRDYVQIIFELHRLNVPMTPIRAKIWSERPRACRPCPACWHGIIGLAVGMDATNFRPYTWGADDLLCGFRHFVRQSFKDRKSSLLVTLARLFGDDFAGFNAESFLAILYHPGGDPYREIAEKEFAQMLVEEREEASFYVDLAISAMDWELHAPELRMLDRYRRLGGTTRVGYSTIVEFLPQVVQVSSMYADADEALFRLLKVLSDWKQSEDMWSYFMTRSLASKVGERCAQVVLEFVLGSPPCSHEWPAPLSCYAATRIHSGAYASHEDSAIQAITHSEAAEIAQTQWTQFVEARRERVCGLVQCC